MTQYNEWRVPVTQNAGHADRATGPGPANSVKAPTMSLPDALPTSPMTRLGNSLIVAILAVSAFVVHHFSSSKTRDTVPRPEPMAPLEFSVKQLKHRGKTLIQFAYTDCGDICQRNLQYFCRVAIGPNNTLYDFLILSNGDCPTCKSDPDVALALTYPHVHFLQRENSGYDFGAYADGLETMKALDNYDYFIFLNAGIRGPLVTARELHDIRNWPQIFLSRLNDKVKMVGPVLSCEQHVHLPSILFAIDTVALRLFLANNIFPKSAESIRELIQGSELPMSKLIFQHGYTISCLMIQYQGVDWRKIYEETGGTLIYNCNRAKNPMVMNWYGRNALYDLQPLETVFVKRGGSIRSLCPNNACSYDAPVDDTSVWIERYLGYNV